MNKKKKLFQYLAFVLISCMMFLAGTEAMKVTELTAVCNVKGLYQEEENSLDVVIIGASEVYASYAPTLAWKEFGYTSYSFGSPGAGGSLYKTMLAEVLQRQKPKVVAFEVNGFLHGDDYNYNEARVRNVIDNMNWSKNRVEAIESIVPEKDRMSFYLPLMAYHGNWTQPGRMLQNVRLKTGICLSGKSYMKGLCTTSYVVPHEKQVTYGKVKYTEKNREILKELLEYCRSQGIEHVLFFRAPHINTPKNAGEMQALWDDVEACGYDAIDFNTDLEGLGLDTMTDFYNEEHLNLYGLEKFTHILGQLFTEEYGLSGEHSGKTAEEWDLCAAKTDEKLADCRKDLENGIKRTYSESCMYWEPSVIPVDNEAEDNRLENLPETDHAPKEKK